MMWKEGMWKRGRRTLTGKWIWSWTQQKFHIHIDGNDSETGRRREPFSVTGDSPE